MERSAEQQHLTTRLRDLETRLQEAGPEVDIEAASPKMRAVLDVLARVASTDASVLLRGENGTGKGVAARLLHLLQCALSIVPFPECHLSGCWGGSSGRRLRRASRSSGTYAPPPTPA